MIRVGTKDVDWLELEIDRLNEDLEPLKEFILPGGGIVPTFCHQARTVCRGPSKNPILARNRNRPWRADLPNRLAILYWVDGLLKRVKRQGLLA